MRQVRRKPLVERSRCRISDMTPLQLPKIDPSLDIVSPPLTCLDTGTIWSQPGNVYTHIVDLAEIDNSR